MQVDTSMTRKSAEQTLVRNLIDFDPESDKTPRHIVEWWASQTFEGFIRSPPKGFSLSPLTYLIDVIQKASATYIRAAYVASCEGMDSHVFNEMAYIAHVRARYRCGLGINISSPDMFVMSELSGALLDLARELEQYGEVPYEDIDECINPPKKKLPPF